MRAAMKDENGISCFQFSRIYYTFFHCLTIKNEIFLNQGCHIHADCSSIVPREFRSNSSNTILFGLKTLLVASYRLLELKRVNVCLLMKHVFF